jgi:hypothetical protein
MMDEAASTLRLGVPRAEGPMEGVPTFDHTVVGISAPRGCSLQRPGDVEERLGHYVGQLGD